MHMYVLGVCVCVCVYTYTHVRIDNHTPTTHTHTHQPLLPYAPHNTRAPTGKLGKGTARVACAPRKRYFGGRLPGGGI